jgi:release factor glutamine methyltransferase
MVTLADVIRQTQDALDSADIPEARLESEVLLTNVLRVPRHQIYAYQEQEITDEQGKLLSQLLERRLKREPLAYILGHKDFYGVQLAVSPGVMIPRPETEHVIEQALFLAIMHMDEGEIIIAEPGTGAGGISINLAIHLPMARIYATELSVEALTVADYNIRRHNVADRVTLLQGDLLEPVPEPPAIIVANLPYIPSERIPTLQPEIQWEPKEALDGGPDGLDTIRKLLYQAKDKMKENGVLVLEIDPEQAEPLEKLAQELFPSATITIEQDLARQDRVFVIDLGEQPD